MMFGWNDVIIVVGKGKWLQKQWSHLCVFIHIKKREMIITKLHVQKVCGTGMRKKWLLSPTPTIAFGRLLWDVFCLVGIGENDHFLYIPVPQCKCYLMCGILFFERRNYLL